jgi:hypothetical protein
MHGARSMAASTRGVSPPQRQNEQPRDKIHYSEQEMPD